MVTMADDGDDANVAVFGAMTKKKRKTKKVSIGDALPPPPPPTTTTTTTMWTATRLDSAAVADADGDVVVVAWLEMMARDGTCSSWAARNNYSTKSWVNSSC